MNRKTNLALFLGVALFPILVGCGVKQRLPMNGPPSTVSGDLPAGVWTTKNKQFLIRPSTANLAVGESSVDYKIVTNEIDVPSPNEYSVTAKYWMPAMPEMPVTPAKIDFSSAGQMKVIYDISMAGEWQVDLSVLRNGKEVDVLSHSYNVAE